MERVNPRSCGLDVHKASVTACIRVAQGEQVVQEVRTFATDGAGLLALRDWLESQRIDQVAMEATGVYWKPVYYALEECAQVMLVNAAHVKQVPGRKTDVADCVVAGAVAGARSVAGQFHSTPADPGSARGAGPRVRRESGERNRR